MLAVFKDVDREAIATTTEMVSAIKVLVLHIDAFNSWLSIIGRICITSSGLASILSAINTENAAYKHDLLLTGHHENEMLTLICQYHTAMLSFIHEC